MLRHPMCSGQMAIVDAPGTIRFRSRTDTEKNFNRFLPVRPISLCIKQPSIKLDVLAVILSERQHGGGFVEEINCSHNKDTRHSLDGNWCSQAPLQREDDKQEAA